MRNLLLPIGIASALWANAQTPLTVDTNFHFYYPNEMIAHWDSIAGQSWTPLVGDLTMRLDGRIMAIGTKLMPLDDVPWGFNHAVVLSETGQPEEFLGQLSGQLLEIPLTNQYLNGNGQRFNYDGSIDWSFGGFGSFQFSVGSAYGNGGWVVFDDRSCLMSGKFVLNGETFCLIKRDEWGQVDTSGFPLRPATGGPDMGGHQIFSLANGQYLLNGRNWTYL